MNFYRYEDFATGYNGVVINLHTFDLLKETPCGYWISKYDTGGFYWGVQKENKRWVSKTSRKRFAYPTKEEAKVNYMARKNRQVIIYTARLERARLALVKGGQL